MQTRVNVVGGHAAYFTDVPPEKTLDNTADHNLWLIDYERNLPNNQMGRNQAVFIRSVVNAGRVLTIRGITAMAAAAHVNYSKALIMLMDLNKNGYAGYYIKFINHSGSADIQDHSARISFELIPDPTAIPMAVPMKDVWSPTNQYSWSPDPLSLQEWNRLKKILEVRMAPDRRLMMALGGHPSIGKTWIAEHHALNGRECANITITEDMYAAQLKGHAVVVEGGRMEWFDGPALRMYKTGGRLVLNEIQRASTNVLSFLLELTESIDSAAITLPPPSRETIKPNPGFQVVASYNGLFEDMPEALKSRFSTNIYLNSANPDAINALPEYLRKIAASSVTVDDPQRRVCLRHWFEFVEYQVKDGLDAKTAAWAVFGERADELLNQIKLLRA